MNRMSKIPSVPINNSCGLDLQIHLVLQIVNAIDKINITAIFKMKDKYNTQCYIINVTKTVIVLNMFYVIC